MLLNNLTSFTHRIGRIVAALSAAVWLSAPLAAANRAQVPDGWFAWPAVEPVAGSAIDVSSLNAKPAGALGRILARDGHFVTPDGQRVRFWGCNLSGDVAFPPKKEVATLARRLAKGGVNIARLHHLDNTWAIKTGGSLWPKNRNDHTVIDPSQLDRLHQLIAALKAQGIYSNLNLKVSKNLNVADGFPATVAQLPLFQKRVDIFDPRMIELQKSYARQLLSTKNPYTGLSAAEDPAVAIIEINNENSLLGFWTRDLGRGLEKLPEPFRGELARQWNAWLSGHYPTDQALAAAWNSPPEPDGARVTTTVLPHNASWVGRTRGAVGLKVASASDDPRTVELQITNASGVAWHAQALLRGVTVRDGDVYTLSFMARADKERPLGVGIGLDPVTRPNEPWRSFGLLETTVVGTDWTSVRLVFSAHSVNDSPTALQLNAGQLPGTVAVRDFSLTRGAEGVGLQPGQSARAGTVPIPTLAGKQQWADWLTFLADTERAYAEQMRSFLRDELGVAAPIVCTQVGEYGGLTGLARERESDFIDAHSYWEHPDLENGDFSSSNWTVGNSPQIAGFNDQHFGKFAELALLRVAGKPFAISEYDHSAPSEFACEMYPTLATFGCRQDWDALYPFDIGLSGSRNRDGKIGRFFDQLHHPAKWGFGPFAALVFRHGLIPPANRTAELILGAPPWRRHLHADLGWREYWNDKPMDFLRTRFAISSESAMEGRETVRRTAGAESRTSVKLSPAPLGQVWVVDDQAAAAAVGFLGGATVDAGALRVSCERFGRDFASVTAIALDEQPLPASKRILITIVARAQNQGMVWNADRTSVGANWGHGPPIVERVPAAITLTGAAGKVVYALAPDGSRARRVNAKNDDENLTFSVGKNDATIHYEIVAQ